MRIILFTALLCLLLIASNAKAQTPAPTGTIPPIYELTGTVNATQSAQESITNQVTLQNSGDTSTPPITIVVTNGALFKRRYLNASSGWECRDLEWLWECSTQTGPLAAGASTTLTLEHTLSFPTADCDLQVPSEVEITFIEGETFCWIHTPSTQAVAIISDTLRFELQSTDIFRDEGCGCLVVEPTSTPTAMPTPAPAEPVSIPEPITLLLFGSGIVGLAGYVAARRR